MDHPVFYITVFVQFKPPPTPNTPILLLSGLAKKQGNWRNGSTRSHIQPRKTFNGGGGGGGDTPLRPGSSSKTRFDVGACRGVQGHPGTNRLK